MAAALTFTRRFDDGWHVHADGVLIGWVVKHDDHWSAYVRQRWGVEGRQIGWDLDTRREAADEVLINRDVWE